MPPSFISQKQLEKAHCSAAALGNSVPERSTHTALCCLPLIIQALVRGPPVLRSRPCKLWTYGCQPGYRSLFSLESSKHSTQQFYTQSSYGHGEINPDGKETECQERGPLERDILSESFHCRVHCSPRHAGSSEALDSNLLPAGSRAHAWSLHPP